MHTIDGPRISTVTITYQRLPTYRPHRSVRILILLPLLAFAVTVGADIQRFTINTHGQAPRLVVKGPFVHQPLDAEQLNDIRHLVTRMQYKQLASLYVSHMTLDEELGQLFMVQSYDPFYSPPLEYMITKLHAG